MKAHVLPSMTPASQVREEALVRLSSILGLGQTAMFAREVMAQRHDYTKMRKKLFGGLTVDAVYRQIVAARQPHAGLRKAK